MCFVLKLIQRPLLGQLLVVPNILPSQVCLRYLNPVPPAFASEFEETTLAAEGRMFKPTVVRWTAVGTNHIVVYCRRF